MTDHDPDAILRTIGLTKRYGRLTALQDLDLDLRVFKELLDDAVGQAANIFARRD